MYCKSCICHEDGTRHPSQNSWSTSEWIEWTSQDKTTNSLGDEQKSTKSACPKENYVGDGYCDDATNIEECFYDGGDCCNKNSEYLFCNECVCHPNSPKIDQSIETTETSNYNYHSSSSSLDAFQLWYLIAILMFKNNLL